MKSRKNYSGMPEKHFVLQIYFTSFSHLAPCCSFCTFSRHRSLLSHYALNRKPCFFPAADCWAASILSVHGMFSCWKNNPGLLWWTTDRSGRELLIVSSCISLIRTQQYAFFIQMTSRYFLRISAGKVTREVNNQFVLHSGLQYRRYLETCTIRFTGYQTSRQNVAGISQTGNEYLFLFCFLMLLFAPVFFFSKFNTG